MSSVKNTINRSPSVFSSDIVGLMLEKSFGLVRSADKNEEYKLGMLILQKLLGCFSGQYLLVLFLYFGRI